MWSVNLHVVLADGTSFDTGDYPLPDPNSIDTESILKYEDADLANVVAVSIHISKDGTTGFAGEI